MDVTAETRSGYYGRIHYGSLFVENRFTGNFGKWPNYYPHRTLRNLWMLSEYMPASRLQMEFLNVARNQELYEGDPLAPAVCGMEYSFAVTMCANPLAWMELTGLNEAEAKVLERILPQYRQVQSDLLSGYVLPIGEEPDGTAWTGFSPVKTEDRDICCLSGKTAVRKPTAVSCAGWRTAGWSWKAFWELPGSVRYRWTGKGRRHLRCRERFVMRFTVIRLRRMRHAFVY